MHSSSSSLRRPCAASAAVSRGAPILQRVDLTRRATGRPDRPESGGHRFCRLPPPSLSSTASRSHAAVRTFGDASEVAWSPDSRALAFLGANGTVTLATVADGRRASLPPSRRSIQGIRFAPDGKSVAVLFTRCRRRSRATRDGGHAARHRRDRRHSRPPASGRHRSIGRPSPRRDSGGPSMFTSTIGATPRGDSWSAPRTVRGITTGGLHVSTRCRPTRGR